MITIKKIAKKGRNIEQILGINVISTPISEVLAGVKKNLSYNSKFYIVTPNPELVLMAQDNGDLKKALNSAEFPVPDGVGLNYASKFLFGKSINIIHGRKLFGDLIREADRNSWKAFFLGGLGSEAKMAATQLGKKYKKVKISSDPGPFLDQNAEPNSENDRILQKGVIDKINKFTPELLFVAFGNPKQEIWIHKNLPKLKAGGAMAVGGTFRYIAGIAKLPPDWMDKLGLEWLWRLLTEPKRLGRIINAVIVFPWKVFLYKLSH